MFLAGSEYNSTTQADLLLQLAQVSDGLGCNLNGGNVQVQVRIGFFGSLRSKLQCDGALQDVGLNVKTGTTLEELLDALSIPPEMARLVVVNGKKGNHAQKLSHHDRISVFPYGLRETREGL